MIARIENISTLDLPQLEPYRTLKQPLEHLQKGIFVAEGEKVVLRLLASNIRTYSVLLSHDWFETIKIKLEDHHDMIDVYVGDKRLIDTIVGHRLHQAIMAIGQVPKPISVTELCERVKERSDFLAVAVDGITNSENMGVIIRNCACFGVDAVIILPTSCNPYLRRSVRNSMGNIFTLPLIHLSDIKNDIAKLKSIGLQHYGAHPDKKSNNIRDVTFGRKSCIVFGSEGYGISKEVLTMCDTLMAIPMSDGVDSLNVASASAVVLFEINKPHDDNSKAK